MATGTKRRAPAEGAAASKKSRLSPNDAAASPTPSIIFTEQASLAETSMTSRSSKRPKRYVCEYDGCGKAFDRPVRLEAHVRTHNGERPFICKEPECDKSFFKSEHLKAHIQNKHADTADYVCHYALSRNADGSEEVCGRTFTTGTRLRRHVAAHDAKEETKCKEPGCGHVFRKMETLQRHVLKDHMNEKAFRCTHTLSTDEGGGEGMLGGVCGQTFSTIGKLKAHEHREHSGLQHFCQTCCAVNGEDEEQNAVGFRTYAELQAHNKEVHPPTCDQCQQAFPSNRALTAHMEIEHSSLASRQKFKCNFPGCERGFTRQGNLKVHYQTVHVKQKSFGCGQFDLCESKHVPGWDGHGCGLAFGTKAALESHVRTQHLHLPALSGGRKKKIKSEDISEVSTPRDHDELPDANDGQVADTLALLTGHGYEDQRPLACWDANCARRFIRDYDLGQHMETAHSWTVDQINDRFTEQQALHGEEFWIGGEEEAAGADLREEQLRLQLEEALQINAPGVAGNGLAGWVEDDAAAKEGSLSVEGGEVMPAIREEEALAVDPALR